MHFWVLLLISFLIPCNQTLLNCYITLGIVLRAGGIVLEKTSWDDKEGRSMEDRRRPLLYLEAVSYPWALEWGRGSQVTSRQRLSLQKKQSVCINSWGRGLMWLQLTEEWQGDKSFTWALLVGIRIWILLRLQWGKMSAIVNEIDLSQMGNIRILKAGKKEEILLPNLRE